MSGVTISRVAASIRHFSSRSKNSLSAWRKGSIVFDLVSIADQISWVVDNKELIAGLVTHWIEASEYFAKGAGQLPDWFKKNDAQNFAKILKPIANDEASQLNIVAEEGSSVIINFNVDSKRAKNIRHGVGRFVGKTMIPSSREFHEEVLQIFQARNVSRSEAGDRGILPLYSDTPKKLMWADEEVKKKIVDRDDNFFHLDFNVSGQVIMKEEKPIAFMVYEVHEVRDRS